MEWCLWLHHLPGSACIITAILHQGDAKAPWPEMHRRSGLVERPHDWTRRADHAAQACEKLVYGVSPGLANDWAIR